MCFNPTQEIVSVFYKIGMLIIRLNVMNKVISRNIFYSSTAGIKYFTHPYFIRRSYRF